MKAKELQKKYVLSAYQELMTDNNLENTAIQLMSTAACFMHQGYELGYSRKTMLNNIKETAAVISNWVNNPEDDESREKKR